jgi:hypothetical protein
VAAVGILQLFWVPREHVHDVVVDTSVLGKTISHSEDRNRISEDAIEEE